MGLFCKPRVEVKQKSKKEIFKEVIMQLIWLTVGAVIVAFALESFELDIQYGVDVKSIATIVLVKLLNPFLLLFLFPICCV